MIERFSEREVIASLERKGCRFTHNKRMFSIPYDKVAGGCVVLGNRSWGKVHALLRLGWKFFEYDKGR